MATSHLHLELHVGNAQGNQVFLHLLLYLLGCMLTHRGEAFAFLLNDSFGFLHSLFQGFQVLLAVVYIAESLAEILAQGHQLFVVCNVVFLL